MMVMADPFWLVLTVCIFYFILRWCPIYTSHKMKSKTSDKKLLLSNGQTKVVWNFGENEPVVTSSIRGYKHGVKIEYIAGNYVNVSLGSQTITGWRYKE